MSQNVIERVYTHMVKNNAWTKIIICILGDTSAELTAVLWFFGEYFIVAWFCFQWLKNLQEELHESKY